ncbi:MAG: glutathione S-transferase [Polaromonas sp.]|nr:glutathione S-transferase [Polaromonas sp.]
MLTLYHAPRSFSSRIIWLLEELGADYQIEIVGYPQADGSGADPRNPHPHGYTPALAHAGQVVSETGAIALYLTDLFPQAEVGVPAGHPLRARYLTWLFYQVGLTEPLVYMKGKQLLAQDAAMSHLNEAMMRHIEDTLAEGPYILGERFTAVDILYMSLFEQARPLLGTSAVLDAYLARADRPARRRAIARDDGGASAG